MPTISSVPSISLIIWYRKKKSCINEITISLFYVNSDWNNVVMEIYNYKMLR